MVMADYRKMYVSSFMNHIPNPSLILITVESELGHERQDSFKQGEGVTK